MNVNDVYNPWGTYYKDKNRFQEYYCCVVEAWKNEDYMYVQQLKDELTEDQWLDLWHRLASNTRREIKDGITALNAGLGSSQ